MTITQYKERQKRMTDKEKEQEKKVRNAKRRERYKNDKEYKEFERYRIDKTAAKRFLTKKIKDEDKEEFKNYLKDL